MRLKSIKLAGFKSFVDPTTVHFPSNMVAVVGPNGCGKSNVIDAVRWVMGESSAKNLRGESMADVIFNGTTSRQPVGQASIELLFDNADGGIGGEYARFSEIGIRRVVSRDGLSDYFLNGTKCRRRDITDIFLGTGLGPRSYAIIEQGMISRLIESRPEELRVFIEEAAGISKYKERRRDTENRIRRTRENLERLTDLRDELGRQLQHLQRQAQAAEKYTKFKDEERELKAQHRALQWRDLETVGSECHAAVQALEVRLEAVNAEYTQVEALIEQQREALSESNEVLGTAQGRYYECGSEVTRLEQEIRFNRERAAQLEADLYAVEQGMGETEAHLQTDSAKLADCQGQMAALHPRVGALRDVEDASSQALTDAEQAMQDWQYGWDEFNQRAAAPRQQAGVQQSRIVHLEQVLQRVHDRRSRLREEEEKLRAAVATGADTAEQQAQLDAREAVLGEQELQLEALHEEINRRRADDSELNTRLASARSEVQALQGRLASLEALQQAALESDDAGVRRWLGANGLADSPFLAEQLDVAAPWQHAVETVLGAALQARCVDTIDSSAAPAQQLESGAIALVDLSKVAPAPAGTLGAVIAGSSQAVPLLAAVYTADTLAAALARRAGLAVHESVITPEGVWLGPNWLRVNRPTDQQAGVLQRQQDLDTVLRALRGARAAVEAAERALSEGRSALQQAEQARQLLLARQRDEERAVAGLRADLAAEAARAQQMQTRHERLTAELHEAAEQYQHEQDALTEARRLLAEAIEGMDRDAAEQEQLIGARDHTRAALDAARGAARRDKDAAHQLAMQEQALSTQIAGVSQAIGRAESQLQQLRERRDTLLASRTASADPLPSLETALNGALQRRVATETELSAAREAMNACDAALRVSETERGAIERRAQGVRSELEQLRLQRQTLQVQRDTILAQLHEMEADPEVVLAALPEERDLGACALQLEQVAARISRLGPINLAAIDEYKLQAERKQYLDAQNADLESALETLEAAIRKIDKETRSRFRETFDKVNVGLQELFPQVFGGGTACLEMTGDDLLDTGVSIIARPPGKKNSTIHLLSGGEKALTAIALVFAIFQLNPAPFCMLDEVDAPLDDANVGRYARMVKKMSETVQFIYITHNKISMELADHLMGVTMYEPGVSRLVSVDIDEAAELAAS